MMTRERRGDGKDVEEDPTDDDDDAVVFALFIGDDNGKASRSIQVGVAFRGIYEVAPIANRS
jgi:hypothetical protein